MVKSNIGKVQNRFKILLAEKETKEGGRIPYSVIQKSTGIAVSTISALANHKVSLYDKDTLAALCYFFNCAVGDLLEYIPPAPRKEKAIN
jgi:putative transcriptional regulator